MRRSITDARGWTQPRRHAGRGPILPLLLTAGLRRFDVAGAQARVDELDAQVARLDAQLEEIEAREAAKLAELNERKAILAERIRLAHDTHPATPPATEPPRATLPP